MPEKYIRQSGLPQIGTAGQQKLKNAKVLVCGVGGLGCPCVTYLASMGIGTIGICDGDTVNASNLNRQFLYTADDIGRSKTQVALNKLQEQFPDTVFIVHDCYMTAENAAKLIENYDAVADCLDTWESKLLLNDACVQQKIPFIHAGVSGFCGQVITIIPQKTACLRCFQTQSDSDKSILGSAAGAVACIQATQLCLLLTDNSPANGIFMLDTLHAESVLLPVERNADCICNLL